MEHQKAMPLRRMRQLTPAPEPEPFSPQAYAHRSVVNDWKLIWEAGPYYEKLAGLLEKAKRHVVLVGWQLDSRLSLDDSGESLRSRFFRLCQTKPKLQIYFLIWDHSSLYTLEREFFQRSRWAGLHPRFHFVFDDRHPYGASHHEKLVIIDGHTAFCGGIDVCADRWDTPVHSYLNPRRSLSGTNETHGPYHDLVAQVSGPLCMDLLSHVAQRWRRVSRIPFPKPVLQPVSPECQPVYLSRTQARPQLREIEFLLQEMILQAEHRILIEGQYYWSIQVHEKLIRRMHELRGQGFEVQMVLTLPERLKFWTRGMERLELELLLELQKAAIQTETRLSIGFPMAMPSVASSGPPKPVYVHSKFMIVDDRLLTVGSANLASRALRIDTELNLTFAAETTAQRKQIATYADEAIHHWRQPHLGFLGLGEVLKRRRKDSSLKPRGRRFWSEILDPELAWAESLKSFSGKCFPGKRFSKRRLRRVGKVS